MTEKENNSMNQYEQTTKELMNFIAESPSRFHVIENVRKWFEEAGFLPLSESEHWELKQGCSYYVIRNDSTLAAFSLPEGPAYNYQIIASHCDSPAFKIKENPEIACAGQYVQLNVEKYGSALCGPWFDRPLGVAGRMVLEQDGKIQSVLVDSKRALALIPSLAIHMNRNANEEAANKIQTDMLPVFGDENAKGSFGKIMAEAAGAAEEQVVASDLFLYDLSAPVIWGAKREYFSSQRLDNLQNVFASAKALISARPVLGDTVMPQEAPIRICCIFNNEEVGSRTMNGADSTFLSDVLERIRLQLSLSEEEGKILLARSFMVSADNGHALHPNHREKADPVNQPSLNGGILIKHSANQKYTTDAVSAALFRNLCKKAGVPVQEFTNHSDIPGGSTLGNVSASHVSINCIDIGCPQLAMHGPYETSGTKATQYMIEAMKAFYDTCIERKGDGSYRLR